MLCDELSEACDEVSSEETVELSVEAEPAETSVVSALTLELSLDDVVSAEDELSVEADVVVEPVSVLEASPVLAPLSVDEAVDAVSVVEDVEVDASVDTSVVTSVELASVVVDVDVAVEPVSVTLEVESLPLSTDDALPPLTSEPLSLTLAVLVVVLASLSKPTTNQLNHSCTGHGSCVAQMPPCGKRTWKPVEDTLAR